MSSRNGLQTVAIIGLIALIATANVWFLVERHEKREHAYQASHKEYQNTKGDLAPGVARDGQRSIADPKSYREEWRDEHDLDAQRDMAEWAFYLLWVSTWGLIVTSIGVFYVAHTLKVNRAAVAVAERTLDETRRQMRAYVLPVKAKITMADDGNFVVTAYATNGGQTPANHVEMRVNGSVMNYPNPGKVLVFKLPFGSRAPVRRGGRVKVKSHPRIATPEDRAAIVQGTKAIYACGGLSYADILGGKWAKDFRFFYRGPWGGTHNMYIAAEGNDPEREIEE